MTFTLIAGVVLVLDIVALIDVFARPMGGGAKILWVLAILLFPVIGMLVYFALGRGTIA